MKIYEKKKDSSIQISQIQKLTKFTSYEFWISTPFPPSYHLQCTFLRPKQFQSLADHRDFRSRYVHWKSVEQTTVSRKTDSVTCPIRAISQRSMYLPGLVLLRPLRNISRSLALHCQPNYNRTVCRETWDYDRSNSSSFFLPLVFAFWIEKYGDGGWWRSNRGCVRGRGRLNLRKCRFFERKEVEWSKAWDDNTWGG